MDKNTKRVDRDKFKAILNERGTTVAWCAKQCLYNYRHFRVVVTGQEKITPRLLFSLCSLLGVEEKEILERDDAGGATT